MAVKKNTTSTVIQIPAPNIKTAKFTIVGTAPLIFHKWSQKAIDMMLDKQMKKELKGRATRNPEEEYQESFYKDKKGNIAFPANSLKQAIVDSARNLEGVTMTILRGALFIVPDDEDGLIKVKYKSKEMRQDMVRVGMGSADIRFRGQVKDWSMDLVIKYNADLLSVEQVASLIQYAGFSCGIGEWRPQRNGDFGTFTLKA